MPSGTDVLQTWFRRVWNEEDRTAIDEMFPSGGEANGLGEQILVGPEEFRQFHTALCGLLSNISVSIDKSVDDGEWCSLLCTMRATCRTSQKQVVMTGTAFSRVENGQIVETYNHWDFLGLWIQMDLLPANSFERALSGQRICKTD